MCCTIRLQLASAHGPHVAAWALLAVQRVSSMHAQTLPRAVLVAGTRHQLPRPSFSPHHHRHAAAAREPRAVQEAPSCTSLTTPVSSVARRSQDCAVASLCPGLLLRVVCTVLPLPRPYAWYAAWQGTLLAGITHLCTCSDSCMCMRWFVRTYAASVSHQCQSVADEAWTPLKCGTPCCATVRCQAPLLLTRAMPKPLITETSPHLNPDVYTSAWLGVKHVLS